MVLRSHASKYGKETLIQRSYAARSRFPPILRVHNADCRPRTCAWAFSSVGCEWRLRGINMSALYVSVCVSVCVCKGCAGLCEDGNACPVCVSVCVSVSVSVCNSVCVSVSVSVCNSVCFSVSVCSGRAGLREYGNACTTCIMHSSRVGFWNTVFAASAYLGFTNSTTRPAAPTQGTRNVEVVTNRHPDSPVRLQGHTNTPIGSRKEHSSYRVPLVRSRTAAYSGMANTSWLMLPGKGE